MTDAGENDIVLKLLHTADWHLGKRFPGFKEEHAVRLTRARLEVLERILASAERNRVDAVLCAGDLFDVPAVDPDWWEGLAASFQKRKWEGRPVFLLPGNHDPLLPDSLWAKGHKFRTLLPDWVHVVDRPDFQWELPRNAVLYAVPCCSRSGAADPTEQIPVREPGDERIRIGMVHGSTFDVKGYQTNFPIDANAAVTRGLDYLALGDTHGFRFVPPDRLQPPTIYPGAPEPTAFDEQGAGSVAIVLVNRQRHVRVNPERVARWTWEDLTVTSLVQLRALASRTDLRDRVFRLRVEMTVSPPEHEEASRILSDLEGTDARQGRIDIISIDRSELKLDTRNVDAYCTDLPDVLLSAVRRLKKMAEDPAQKDRADRALLHLYSVSRKKAS